MNRRGFISLLAGAAGGVLVPWRGRVEPRVFVPPRILDYSRYLTSPNTWFIKTDFSNRAGPILTEESLDHMLDSLCYMGRGFGKTVAGARWIVDLIDTNPVVAEAAWMALNGEYLPEELGLK